jgi:hypothetical protein
MKPNVRTILLFAAGLGLVALPVIFAKKPATPPAIAVTPRPAAEAQPKIQVALLLDTSNSMDGLIEQAKSQLWKIVNELASAKKDGQVPKVEIALYEYGKASLPQASGYMRPVLSFTSDLDKVSEELFRLTTNGGEEYCGMVIGRATSELGWSDDDKDMKLIFIAGNEPFTQGSVDYHRTVAAAKRKGIVVNTIFCGPEAEGANTGWRVGAILAGGRFMSIDQDRAIVTVDAPQDGEIAALGAKINETYIPYGALGDSSYQRQSAQDQNAAQVRQGAMINRSVSKASAAYDNSGWDLVDAIRGNRANVETVSPNDLPAPMRNMSVKERAAYVETKMKERDAIQKRIQTLNEERNAFVASELKKRGQSDATTLDKAMIRAIDEEATSRGFHLSNGAR